MRLMLLFACLVALPAIADAGTRCPTGTYVARYSFGIWVCKRITRPKLACPPGEHLAEDLLGTPGCVWTEPRSRRER